VIWEALHEWQVARGVCVVHGVPLKFLDLGSGMSGVCWMAALLGGAEATGMELRLESHAAAQ